MNFKYLILILFPISGALNGQALRNEGYLNVSGGHLVVLGNYQNEGSGNIILDGSISVTGNWTNNVNSDSVIVNTDGTGLVVFNGTGLQTIGGTTNAPFVFEGITINPASSVEVQAGKGVTTEGASTFSTPLILRTTYGTYHPQMASFINNAAVTGNITSEFFYQSTGSSAPPTARPLVFASPVSNATTAIFMPSLGTNLLFYQDEVQRKTFPIATDTVAFTPGRGYIVRSAVSDTFQFTGPVNYSAAPYTMTYNRVDTGHYFYLGNPFPTAIDWDNLAKSNMSTTVWYRTFNGSAVVVDTWNGSLGVGTSNNGTPVDNMIGPLQGFYVKGAANGSASLTIDLASRSHNLGSAPFLKSAEVLHMDRRLIRMFLHSGSSRDESILVQSDAASDGLDELDSKKLFSGDTDINGGSGFIPPYAEFYSLTGNLDRLVIQSVRPVDVSQTQADYQIPLGLRVNAGGNYSFQALVQDESPLYYYLEDKEADAGERFTDLRSHSYTFRSGMVNDTLGKRFVLHLSTHELTAADIIPFASMNIFSSGNTIFIRNCPPGSEISVIDILGRVRYLGSSGSDFEQISPDVSSGTYIVRVQNSKEVTTRKVYLSVP